MDRPRIGVTTGGRERREFYAEYAEAVEEARGAPEYIDPLPLTDAEASEIVRRIDGLLIPGGKDLHPDSYHSRNEPGDEQLTTPQLIGAYRMNCDRARDELEIPLVRAALRLNLPVFGICRGFQVLNVVFGGTLIKDITTGRKHWAYRHEESDEGTPGDSRSHMVTIVPETKLASMLGDCPLLVNSRHHQGIAEREKAPGLLATAFAPDRITEAVESPDHAWVIAVQWHAERRADDYIYEKSRPLFRGLVEASRG